MKLGHLYRKIPLTIDLFFTVKAQGLFNRSSLIFRLCRHKENNIIVDIIIIAFVIMLLIARPSSCSKLETQGFSNYFFLTHIPPIL